MENVLKRRGISNSSAQTPTTGIETVLTAAMCLGKIGNFRYITPKELLYFIDHGRIEDIQEMDAFFNLVKEKNKMAINRRIQKDKGGNPYRYENFIRPRGNEGVKVMVIGNILQFIADYQQDKWVTNFTLDDLVVEAEKGQ